MSTAFGGMRGFAFLSAASGVSLALFGAMTLGVSLIGFALAGCLIGLALLAHGAIELRARRRALGGAGESTYRGLAYNQLALAASVLAYLGWSATRFDAEGWRAALGREPLRTALDLYPPELVERAMQRLPAIALGFYAVAAFTVAAGCAGMAVYYWRAGRRLRGDGGPGRAARSR